MSAGYAKMYQASMMNYNSDDVRPGLSGFTVKPSCRYGGNVQETLLFDGCVKPPVSKNYANPTIRQPIMNQSYTFGQSEADHYLVYNVDPHYTKSVSYGKPTYDHTY